MATRKLNWGIVGAGRIAHDFCNDLMQLQETQLYGVAARNSEDAQSFAKKYAITHSYHGYQAMFDDPNIDIVYIATPHTCHYQNARDAILAGKHVLCEKPLVISEEQCQSLCELAKEHGVFLMEAMWTYFLPAIQHAKQWIDEGQIGNVLHIKSDFGYPMPYSPESRVYNTELAGGCLLDMGIYPLATAWYFLNHDLNNLHVINQNAPNGVDNDVIITADCGNAKAILATSFQCRLRNATYIIGDQGYIVIPDTFRASQCSLYQLDTLVEEFSDGRNTLGYIYEAMEVINCVNRGELESKIMPHASSLMLQRQMARIKSMFS